MSNQIPDDYWQFLMEWEGRAYECDPDDPGGATKYGIDARSHPGVDIAALTEDQARAIYEKELRSSEAALFDGQLRWIVFDTEINCGRWAARVFAEGNPDCAAYLNRRDRYYRRLCERRPKMKKFLHGWLNRTQALRRLYKIER